MKTWNKIDSAPKDGTVVRCCHMPKFDEFTANLSRLHARFADCVWVYCCDDHLDGTAINPQPTHWALRHH